MIRALALAALLLPSVAAAGPNKKIKAFTTDVVKKLAEGRAVVKEEGVDEFGDPMLTLEYSGLNYLVLFYDCDAKQACEAIQLRAYWSTQGATSLQTINGWNASRRFTTAFIDEDGDASLELYLPAWHATTEGFATRALDEWHDMLRLFAAML